MTDMELQERIMEHWRDALKLYRHFPSSFPLDKIA